MPQLRASLGFSTFPLSESFRFESVEMQSLAGALRAGQSVTIPPGLAPDCDVVLAGEWSRLWAASDDILPFSFGQAGNRIDAAIALLLDQVVVSRFGSLSTFGPDAAVVLGLDPELVRIEGGTRLGPVLEVLAGGTEQSAADALGLLQKTLIGMGSRPIPTLQADNQAVPRRSAPCPCAPPLLPESCAGPHRPSGEGP